MDEREHQGHEGTWLSSSCFPAIFLDARCTTFGTTLNSHPGVSLARSPHSASRQLT